LMLVSKLAFLWLRVFASVQSVTLTADARWPTQVRSGVDTKMTGGRVESHRLLIRRKDGGTGSCGLVRTASRGSWSPRSQNRDLGHPEAWGSRDDERGGDSSVWTYRRRVWICGGIGVIWWARLGCFFYKLSELAPAARAWQVSELAGVFTGVGFMRCGSSTTLGYAEFYLALVGECR